MSSGNNWYTVFMKAGVDYIGVCVSFFCRDANGNLLLHKRSKNCRDEHERWDCGGGKLEFGETWEDGVRREIREEYKAEVRDLQYIATSNVLRENNGVKTHWICLIFTCIVDPNDVKVGEPNKMMELGWFSKDTLPTPLHSMLGNHLQKVIDAGYL